MRNNKGFTLWEMLIAMGIIGILAMVATPLTLRARTNLGLRSAVMDLKSNTLLAKSLAAKENQRCSVTFTQATNHQYTITIIDGAGAVVSNVKTVDLSDYYSNVRFGKPVAEPDPTIADITFQPRGVCTVPGTGTVFLTNASNSDFYRLFFPVSGVVTTQMWNDSSNTWN